MPSATTNIVDLMKTPNGYSIYENDVMINKPAIVVNNVAAMQSISSTMQHTSLSVKEGTSSNVVVRKAKYIGQCEKQNYLLKTTEFTLQHQNFTIYPYIYSKQQQTHRFVILPSRSQWFDLHNIHQIQRKQLPQWFKQKKGIMAAIVIQSKFQKNQELYKKYRNYIIDLGKTQYVSPTMARKGLAGDACAIMRIHKFLQKWGLVNFVHKKPNKQQQSNQSQIINGFHSSLSEKFHGKKKDGFDKQRSLLSKIYDKDDLELLKKITLKFRPLCNSCQTLCGVSWHEYTQKLTRKYFHNSEIQPSTKVVQSGQNFEYHIKVCNTCFYDKNFPVVLNFDDFTKKSLISQMKEIDFDSLYGKKKVQQLSRLADVLQKNRFNLQKSSQQLKIEEHQLMGLYLQVPVQYLQKMSRVDVETEDDDEYEEGNNMISNNEQRIRVDRKQSKSVSNGQNNNTNINVAQNLKEASKYIQTSTTNTTNTHTNDQQLLMLQAHSLQLQKQEKKIYEQFLQAWLMKMYVKLQQLQKWDKSVQWRLYENEALKKYHLAEKIKLSLNKVSLQQQQQQQQQQGN